MAVMARDFDANPYSKDEERVCKYLQRVMKNQIGCGDDPIGFLLASHAAFVYSSTERLLSIDANGDDNAG